MEMGTVVVKTLTTIQLMNAIVNGAWGLYVDSIIPSQSIHIIPLLYPLDSKLILEGSGWLIHAESTMSSRKHHQHNTSGWQLCLHVLGQGYHYKAIHSKSPCSPFTLHNNSTCILINIGCSDEACIHQCVWYTNIDIDTIWHRHRLICETSFKLHHFNLSVLSAQQPANFSRLHVAYLLLLPQQI